jgi:hypothetical protein
MKAILASEVAVEGLQASAEKRAPAWTGANAGLHDDDSVRQS